MEDETLVLEIEEVSALELAELKKTLRDAQLDPDQILRAPEKPATTKLGEPASSMIIIQLAKVAIPAIATVLSAWLTARNAKPTPKPKKPKSKKMTMRRGVKKLRSADSAELVAPGSDASDETKKRVASFLVD